MGALGARACACRPAGRGQAGTSLQPGHIVSSECHKHPADGDQCLARVLTARASGHAKYYERFAAISTVVTSRPGAISDQPRLAAAGSSLIMSMNFLRETAGADQFGMSRASLGATGQTPSRSSGAPQSTMLKSRHIDYYEGELESSQTEINALRSKLLTERAEKSEYVLITRECAAARDHTCQPPRTPTHAATSGCTSIPRCCVVYTGLLPRWLRCSARWLRCVSK